MTVINLTEEYLRTGNPSLYERARMVLNMDEYWASSLSAIEEHFRGEPPRKRDRKMGQNSAHILMDNLEIKRQHPDSFDEEDGASPQGLDEGMCLPVFQLRDHTSHRLAYWMAGKFSDYLEAQTEFGFNRERFVRVPRTRLQYFHIGERGWLAIKEIRAHKQPKQETKSLRERVLELAPTIQVPTLQPIH